MKPKSPKPAPIDLAAAQAFAALHLPGAQVNGKMGGASFCIAGKVFAFTRLGGLVLKLPPDAIAKLLATRDATHLTKGKRVMHEWALLSVPSRESYIDELPLLKKAMAFVKSLG